VPRGAKSRMRRTETPKPIWIKFCTVIDISDVVTYTNFGDHQLRVFLVAGGQISPFPIYFHCRAYNTLALPCECVMTFATYIFLTQCNQSNALTPRAAVGKFTLLSKSDLRCKKLFWGSTTFIWGGSFRTSLHSYGGALVPAFVQRPGTPTPTPHSHHNHATLHFTRTSAIAEGPRDAPCQLKPCKMSLKCSSNCI